MAPIENCELLPVRKILHATHGTVLLFYEMFTVEIGSKLLTYLQDDSLYFLKI